MREGSGGCEFDRDAENTRHLKRHRITPDEFEELMVGDPMYLEYQAPSGKNGIRSWVCPRLAEC
jgi:hypothetical protein